MRARLAVGGTLLAARLVGRGEYRRAFNPAGGLHHARRDRAGGFCPFNDVVIAIRALQAELGYRRIAVIDLYGHHGDGTEQEQACRGERAGGGGHGVHDRRARASCHPIFAASADDAVPVRP